MEYYYIWRMEFALICSANTFEDTLIYCEKLSREFSGWIARDAEMNGGGRREREVRRRERERRIERGRDLPIL